MLTKTSALALSTIFLAVPASATGGLLCETASGPATQISFVVGHHDLGGIVSANWMTEAGWRPATMSQSWITADELKADFVDDPATKRIARIEARRNGEFYDGQIVEDASRRWIRCREY